MNHLEELARLQKAYNETLVGGVRRDKYGIVYSYAYGTLRPKIHKELGQAVESARKAGVTDDDIDELVLELEMETGRRPIELENFWDPRRMSKVYRRQTK